jgi:hypothetical protein
MFVSVIGKLARTAKSRVHTEKNLVNRYLHEQSFAIDILQADSLEDGQHPLVPLGSVNSEVDSAAVLWPQLSRFNSSKVFQASTHLRTRVLDRLFGQAMCALHALHSTSSFSCRGTTRSVQVGRWKFSTRAVDHDDDAAGGKSSAYWFCIRARNVPKWVDHRANMHEQRRIPEDEVKALGDRLLYGTFQQFLEVKLPEWPEPDNHFFMGQCKLYSSHLYDGVSPANLPVINLDEPVAHWSGKGDEMRIVRELFIQLRHVESAVAVAPHVQWKPPTSRRGHAEAMPRDKPLYVVMALQA